VILNDPIAMPATADDLWLTIWSYDDVECGSCGWDWRFVYVSAEGGPWTLIGESDTIGKWYQPAFDLTPYVGQNIRFKFHFDAVDAGVNEGLGWFIDNVRITANGCDNSTTYCDGFANSVGDGSSIGFTGSTSIAADDFTVTSSGNPASQFGTFFYGPAEIFLPAGDGMRCVGSGATGVFRLDPSSFSDPMGSFQRPVDFGALPAGGFGAGAITAGSTWKFQLWYRDPTGPGGAFFNYSDAMSVTFCP
jgi:hypothetical protein